MSNIKPEEIKNLIEDNVFSEIVFGQITDSSLRDITCFQKLFPHWKKNSIVKKIRKTVSGKDYRFIVRKDDEIIAHVKVFVKKTPHEHVAEMTSLIVKESERKKGIASKLINYSLSKLPSQILLIVLAVDSKNKIAINLYEKNGFKEYGLLKNGSMVNNKLVDNVLMVKEIKPKKKSEKKLKNKS